MSIYDHAEEFFGKPVKEWRAGTPLDDPSGTAYRLALDYDEAEKGESWERRFEEFLSQPGSENVTAIVVGVWGDASAPLGDSQSVVDALVGASERLPNLKALFIGDITGEEFEISWIEQSDMSPIFPAFPSLECFRVRGGQALRFGTLNHNNLRSLIVETGGLDVSVVRDITSSTLPELEHLELWLGSDSYGGNTEIVDLAPIFSGKLFPRLTYLGLRDSELSDAIAAAVSHSPLMERLRVLDLSLGTLSDSGVAALLASPAVAKLEFLNLNHHYCSDDMMQKLQGLGIKVDLSEQQEADDDDDESTRYVAVSE